VSGKTYEERPCFACNSGMILHAERPMDRPKRKPCPKCGGTGFVAVYLYPRLGESSR
jgi:hypothetical protein